MLQTLNHKSLSQEEARLVAKDRNYKKKKAEVLKGHRTSSEDKSTSDAYYKGKPLGPITDLPNLNLWEQGLLICI